MWITDPIFDLLWEISDLFWDAYTEVNTWVWPFNKLADPLYWLSWRFWDWLTPIANLGDWIDGIAGQLAGFLDASGILALLSDWITQAEAAWNWVRYAAWNIWNEIADWWASTSLTVQGWIDSAIAGVQTLINQVFTSLGNLRTEWDNFWTLTWPSLVADLGGLRSAWENFLTVTLPGLASWPGIQSLIDSTLSTWFPFYDDLVNLWGTISNFFTGPFDWLAARLEVWFWGES